MARHRGAVIALAAGALLLAAGPAQAAGGTATVQVPGGFVSTLSDTRATGHLEVQGTGLRLWTEGATSTDKVAEYVATNTPLAAAGEPSLAFTNTSGGGVPGAQLVVDVDADGTSDGILIGEPGVYGADWWLNTRAAQFVKDGAPVVGAGSGSPHHGTLDQWRSAFPDAEVDAFGFSLGSGVKGDGVLDAIEFAGVRHTFVAPVVLTSKEQCKKGGWATSTSPVFADQGSCVSSFAGSRRPVPAV